MNKSRNEIPTIDVNLVTITTKSGKEFGFDTANQIEVEVQTETQDAVRLVVKGRLRAQKPEEATITGHQITLHDNVFNPELVKVLQGGKILYFQDADKQTMSENPTNFGFAKYTPPVAGSAEKGEVFTLNAYSAIYNAAGVITGYEKTIYPNCQGVPVAFSSEDGTFRAPEYTINSAPDTGEAPYDIEWVPELPVLDDPDAVHVTGITVAPTTSTLYIGGTVSITANVEPALATDKSVTWSTGDDTIATVDSNGVITAVGVGNTTVTVTTVDGGFTADVDVTVQAKAAVTVTGTDGSTTYDSESSDPQTFDATTLFVTDPATGIGAITYSITAGDNVATIDSSTGLVTITGTGEITITAIVAETATTQAASGSAVLTITAA